MSHLTTLVLLVCFLSVSLTCLPLSSHPCDGVPVQQNRPLLLSATRGHQVLCPTMTLPTPKLRDGRLYTSRWPAPITSLAHFPLPTSPVPSPISPRLLSAAAAAHCLLPAPRSCLAAWRHSCCWFPALFLDLLRGTLGRPVASPICLSAMPTGDLADPGAAPGLNVAPWTHSTGAKSRLNPLAALSHSIPLS